MKSVLVNYLGFHFTSLAFDNQMSIILEVLSILLPMLIFLFSY